MRTSSPNSSHCSKRLLAGTERSGEELLFGWHDRIEVSDQFLHANRAQRQWTWKYCSLFSVYVCAFNVTMRCRLALHPVLKAVDIDFPARAKAASTLSRSWRLRWRTWITCDVTRERQRQRKQRKVRKSTQMSEIESGIWNYFWLFPQRSSHFAKPGPRRDGGRIGQCGWVAWPRPYSALSSKSELPHAAPFPVA